ncbi:hypothetical protein EUR_18940 [Agathobacter rectalis DSM 17629]|nr:hypothetical protein EUR_18940 [Agathobacter rectalis DSM 17629]
MLENEFNIKMESDRKG